jgi:hypothetical protein
MQGFGFVFAESLIAEILWITVEDHKENIT